MKKQIHLTLVTFEEEMEPFSLDYYSCFQTIQGVLQLHFEEVRMELKTDEKYGNQYSQIFL